MRRIDRRFRLAATLLLGTSFFASGLARAQDAVPAAPFRVCADPDNRPFSSASADTPGLYVELGAKIARQLGRQFSAVWTVSYFGKRTVRTTLLAGKCEAMIGLPEERDFIGPQLVFSQPLLHVGYVLMAPEAAPVTQLGQLAGKAVAVQFSTPPQLVLADRADLRAVTFLNPEDAAEALIQRHVDAAFIWGPVAGYINATRLQGAYRVTPVAGEGRQWPVAIGFAKANSGLRDQVNRVLQEDATAIATLAAKYGMDLPFAATVQDQPEVSGVVKVAASGETTEEKATPTSLEQPTATVPTPPKADQIAAGREIFNGTCSHCHGPDAVQSERRINLRLLHHRYGDNMAEVFHTTVTHGRPDKGMPNWTGVFSEEDFSKILAFLKTVQTD